MGIGQYLLLHVEIVILFFQLATFLLLFIVYVKLNKISINTNRLIATVCTFLTFHLSSLVLWASCCLKQVVRWAWWWTSSMSVKFCLTYSLDFLHSGICVFCERLFWQFFYSICAGELSSNIFVTVIRTMLEAPASFQANARLNSVIIAISWIEELATNVNNCTYSSQSFWCLRIQWSVWSARVYLKVSIYPIVYGQYVMRDTWCAVPG